MSAFLEHILNAPPWLILIVVAAIVFAEDALFVGFVIPGETAAILAGVAASVGDVPLPAAYAVVVVAAVVGDSVGYEVGRRIGPRVLELKQLRRRRERIEGAQDFLARRGGFAVFLGRWTAFLRAVMPALAGTARMPYPRFFAFNATGGALWAGVVVTVGYLAGHEYHRIETWIGRAGLIALGVVIVVALVVWRVRAHRRETSGGDGDTTPADNGTDGTGTETGTAGEGGGSDSSGADTAEAVTDSPNDGTPPSPNAPAASTAAQPETASANSCSDRSRAS